MQLRGTMQDSGAICPIRWRFPLHPVAQRASFRFSLPEAGGWGRAAAIGVGLMFYFVRGSRRQERATSRKPRSLPAPPPPM